MTAMVTCNGVENMSQTGLFVSDCYSTLVRDRKVVQSQVRYFLIFQKLRIQAYGIEPGEAGHPPRVGEMRDLEKAFLAGKWTNLCGTGAARRSGQDFVSLSHLVQADCYFNNSDKIIKRLYASCYL